MRAHSLAFLLLTALSAPALALDLVEMRDGRVYEARWVALEGNRLHIALNPSRPDQRIEFAVPIEKVVPEFVYYVWARTIQPGDAAGHVKLADWSRSHGLFGLALRQYEAAAKSDPEVRASLAELRTTLHEEEATWLFHEAERLFREDETKSARARAEAILKSFVDTKEVGRAKTLLAIIAEREQFLSEQRREEEIARHARKQRRTVDQHLSRIEHADRLVRGVRLSHTADAKWRLSRAALTYRRALITFQELLLEVEVDDLRNLLRVLLGDVQVRIVRTFLRLADVRYVTGDSTRALEAVHEVLALEPDNKSASDLRGRILDDSRRIGTDTTTYYPYGGRFLHRFHRRRHVLHGHAYPYPVRTLGFRRY